MVSWREQPWMSMRRSPPRDLSLTGLQNVVSLPHIEAATVEAQRANSTVVAEKLIKILG